MKDKLYPVMDRVMTTLDRARLQLDVEFARLPAPYPARLEEIAEIVGVAYRDCIEASKLARRKNGKMERPRDRKGGEC